MFNLEDAISDLIKHVNEVFTNSRERSLVITKLQEAQMWAREIDRTSQNR